MKWILGILLAGSLCLNGYLIYEEVQYSANLAFGEAVNRSMGMRISKTKWSEGSKLFQTKLEQTNKALAEKKYYYINIWTSWCAPCIREMPWLDSIAGSLNKDVGYVFVSEMSDTVANTILKKKNYHLKNFILLNNMNDFVSSICNEQQIKSKVYPMVLILTNTGEVKHYSTGAYSNRRDATGFSELIDQVCQ